MAWDQSSRHLLSVTLGKHICVWALPAAHQAGQGPAAATQPPILKLQLVFSSTSAKLALNAPPEAPVVGDAESYRLTTMLHWHVQPPGFQVWLLAGGRDVLSALHSQAKSDQTVGLAPTIASVSQQAAGIRSTSQHHRYQGHKVRPFAGVFRISNVCTHMSSFRVA